MNGNYIIKNKDGFVLNFYYEDEGIFFKKYNDDKWEDRGRLIDGVRCDFSVNLSDEGDIYLICQNIRGDVILLNQNNNTWQEKIILKSQNENGNNILFYSLINKEEMELVYTIDYGNKKSEIMTQSINKKGGNSGAELVDYALSLPEGCFKMQRLKDSHYVIFYHKREGENQLGYKEINRKNQSEYMVFHKTGYRIIDSSFLADKNGIHFLYIVKSMFSSQVIYRRKTDNGLSSPIILYEGQGLNLCSLFYVKGILYASWIMNRQLYYAVSKTYGEKFDKVIRDKKYNSVNWIKANYISFKNMNKDELLTNEIYTENKKDWEPACILDFYGEFYKQKTETISNEKKQAVSAAETEEPNNESVKIMIERMKNQVEIAQKQSNEKDRQLIQLNNVIQAKNREIIRIESTLSKKINELRAENARLKEEKEKIENSKKILQITDKKQLELPLFEDE